MSQYGDVHHRVVRGGVLPSSRGSETAQKNEHRLFHNVGGRFFHRLSGHGNELSIALGYGEVVSVASCPYPEVMGRLW